ncbi:paraquat-inducible protein A [Hasllibacter halocynthiae]|uniref:Paraquat-inducible protein A n=1 Tax=Hasllibacter halocynthiae TaxID=595589 RepID=A0A2T0X320_9RHOB|nr:paraquat-inducible protein A [Hasllibacter halocynthiae]PRY93307.1 paraquat-inducible protein A [Hasllibacter halocynthiae]
MSAPAPTPAAAASPGEGARVITAREAGLVGCRRCHLAHAWGTERCTRCGTPLQSRDETSLQRVWAWWIAGVLFYIPANLYPMLSTRVLFTTHEATIVEGAIQMAQSGAVGIAAIILIASVGIPVAKFAAIAWLAWSVQRPGRGDGHRRTVLYEVVEFIGRWSMIDIFVVAITSALVHLRVLVSVTPGPAAIAFALSVIFTMLAARSFDSRLIWDGIGRGRT